MTTVRAALIQANANMEKKEAIDKHVEMIADAARQGAQIVGLQEIFFGPYFCAEQDPKWYATAEPDDGPTVTLMQEVAREHGIVLVVPWYEEEQPGRVLQHRVRHRARTARCSASTARPTSHRSARASGRSSTSSPGTSGTPCSRPSVGKVGLIICYDRHFPEVARELGLKGAELVFNPSATVTSLSRYLWELEQPAHAVANGYFVAASNRVGVEKPLNSAEFYGSSYFCSPRGKILAQASETEDEVLVCDLDLDEIREVRDTWQFLRDRRPETYGELTQLLP